MTTPHLQPRTAPDCDLLKGRCVYVESLDAQSHGPDLDSHICGKENATLWDFIPFGAVADFARFNAIIDHMQKTLGWRSFALRALSTGEVTGTFSLMRIRPEHGSAELGSVVFGEALQKTRASTEAVFLMANYLFGELGYRRFEWKCDSRNAASRRAADRYGFQYEGIFRNDMIVRGRNRDTAWFAMTDGDWSALRPAYNQWLDDSNFDKDGAQKHSLSALTRAAMA